MLFYFSRTFSSAPSFSDLRVLLLGENLRLVDRGDGLVGLAHRLHRRLRGLEPVPGAVEASVVPVVGVGVWIDDVVGGSVVDAQGSLLDGNCRQNCLLEEVSSQIF